MISRNPTQFNWISSILPALRKLIEQIYPLELTQFGLQSPHGSRKFPRFENDSAFSLLKYQYWWPSNAPHEELRNKTIS